MEKSEYIPKLAITMGDPAGIGPEIVIRSLTDKSIFEKSNIIVLGDFELLKKVRRESGFSVDFNIIKKPSEAKEGVANLINLSNINLDNFKFGESRIDLGLISTFYIVKAAEFAVAGDVDALVTSPINKAMLHQAGYNFTSHSEMLMDYTEVEFAPVMMVGKRIRITRTTSHAPIKEVAERLTKRRVLNAIRLTNESLKKDFDIEVPHLAVCGLNPHAGEKGLFGDEEEEIIAPAIAKAKAEGIQTSGPLPADTVFPKARDGEYDAVVCMYHDQGHIAFRLLDFGYGVNTTLGLPIVRTSPDHGAGYDIAGKNYASERSMLRAIKLASNMAHKRLKS